VTLAHPEALDGGTQAACCGRRHRATVGTGINAGETK
jgi:hypothetical protein